MSADWILTSDNSEGAVPVRFASPGDDKSYLRGLTDPQRAFVDASGFEPKGGKVVLVPSESGGIALVLFGAGARDNRDRSPFLAGRLADSLPEGTYRIEGDIEHPELALLGFALGRYRFDRYRCSDAARDIRLCAPGGINVDEINRIARGVTLARDLINTPSNDMGPAELEAAVRDLAAAHGARIETVVGEDLLEQNFPMIHAVGRASDRAPRLIDMVWGRDDAPRITLVGKGVCFDTGGLDIKPSSGMLLMKKDMGGAANVLGLASMIMDARLPVRLRVLIPAVENAISANAFRPGDVLKSRSGVRVAIGNTDAEGQLVLADAITLACEDSPDLLVDMATLTGAARVALGPDIPPFYTHDDTLASELAEASVAVDDPIWRLPLWKPYMRMIESKVADIDNAGSGGFAGSITAALFLSRFVDKETSWVHFNVYAWNPSTRPGRPEGGEAQAIRALYRVLKGRYGVGR